MKKGLSLLLILALLIGFVLPAQADEPAPAGLTGWAELTSAGMPAQRQAHRQSDADFTPDSVYSKMIALKSQYPEGMRYTNDNYYVFQGLLDGTTHVTGFGCVGFAGILSDAVFGTLPIYRLDSFTYEDVRPGDILRINGDQHSVVVLQKFADHVVLAEANYNSSVHWGRTLSKAQVLQADFIWTRYPSSIQKDAVPLTWNRLQEGVNQDSVAFRFTPQSTDWRLQFRVGTFGRFVVTDGGGNILEQFEGWDDGVMSYNSTADYVPGNSYYLRFTIYYGTANFAFLMQARSAAPLPTEFVDVSPGSYYADSVRWAVEEAVTAGLDSWHFGPAKPCTRGQVVTFLWRAAGCPEGTQAAAFSDVPAGAYYAKAVDWAVEYGITQGTGAGRFSPNASCTRAQIVTFLYRCAQLEEKRELRPGITDPDQPEPTVPDESTPPLPTSGNPTPAAGPQPSPEPTPEPVNETPFTDIRPTAYYYPAVKWAVEQKITSGLSPDTFGPGVTCTRAQVVTFLYRLDVK